MDCEFKRLDDDGNGIYYMIAGLVTVGVAIIFFVAACIWANLF